MPNNCSPLRYPGGKTQLYHFVHRILECNNLLGETYVEPFAGGAGLGLKLLLENEVKKIIINDFDFAIYSIWYCILNYTDDFCNKIEQTSVSLNEWDRQKSIYNSKTKNVFDMGFSAFYLNRTNRSGVIKGGMIGGRDQAGKYKIDARFNKKALQDKIRRIASKRDKIVLTNMDASEFISSGFLNHYYKTFINFDPPYVIKGSQLYKNSYTEGDHRSLAQLISKCSRKWMVTYDICPLTEELYGRFRTAKININYSVGNSVKANEYAFFSNNLTLPDDINLLNLGLAN